MSTSAADSWARGEGILQADGYERPTGLVKGCCCPQQRWPASNTCAQDTAAAAVDLCAECYDASCTTEEARCG